jgi:hypothetical protein
VSAKKLLKAWVENVFDINAIEPSPLSFDLDLVQIPGEGALAARLLVECNIRNVDRFADARMLGPPQVNPTFRHIDPAGLTGFQFGDGLPYDGVCTGDALFRASPSHKDFSQLAIDMRKVSDFHLYGTI